MRDLLALSLAAAALVAAACGGARTQVRAPAPASARPASAVAASTAAVSDVAASTAAVNPVPNEPQKPLSSDANFVLLVCEAVGGPEEDLASYTKVFVDGKEAGATAVGPKSVEKKWGTRLEPGNHLFRFEKWNLPSVGDWAALDAQWQQPERFIRVEPGQRTIVRLKFFDGGTGSTLTFAREPLSAPLP